jgi:membrane AbrB-like protein
MQKHNKLKLNVFLILLSLMGGFIFSFSGLPIAWLLGSLILASLGTIVLKWMKLKGDMGIYPFWRQLGQTILGIELGQNVNISFINTIENHFIVIIITLILTITISLLSGIVLWRYSSANMMTSLFASTPGGISAMPAIAEEVGANSVVVTIIQTLRILLVVGTIPLLVGAISTQSETINPAFNQSYFEFHSLLWTACLIIGACGGALIGKTIKMPVPWLIGSMLGVTFIQLIGTLVTGESVMAYWPHHLLIFAQILIGSSIGSRVSMDMFKGLGKTFFISIISTLTLVTLIMIMSVGISFTSHIPLVTCILAFAPGGVAEMTTAAIALHADSIFVLAVQSIRLFTIIILLPSLFRFVNNRAIVVSEKNNHCIEPIDKH